MAGVQSPSVPLSIVLAAEDVVEGRAVAAEEAEKARQPKSILWKRLNGKKRNGMEFQIRMPARTDTTIMLQAQVEGSRVGVVEVAALAYVVATRPAIEL